MSRPGMCPPGMSPPGMSQAVVQFPVALFWAGCGGFEPRAARVQVRVLDH